MYNWVALNEVSFPSSTEVPSSQRKFAGRYRIRGDYVKIHHFVVIRCGSPWKTALGKWKTQWMCDARFLYYTLRDRSYKWKVITNVSFSLCFIEMWGVLYSKSSFGLTPPEWISVFAALSGIVLSHECVNLLPNVTGWIVHFILS